MSIKKSLVSFKDAFGNEVVLGDSVAYIKCARQSAGSIHHGIVKRITPEGAWIIPDKKWKNDACNKKIYKSDAGSVCITNWKPWNRNAKFVRDTIIADCYYAPYSRVIKYA